MNWLREHMRDHIANSASIDSPENILKFPRDAPASSRNGASAALGLVAQAAEVIRSIEDRAVLTEARAKNLAESAIEKLKFAEARIQSAETARRAAEEVLRKVSAQLEVAEEERNRTRSLIAAATAQLTNAEQRMREAEMRAINAEKALQKIEHAIRTQIVGLARDLARKSAAAA